MGGKRKSRNIFQASPANTCERLNAKPGMKRQFCFFTVKCCAKISVTSTALSGPRTEEDLPVVLTKEEVQKTSWAPLKGTPVVMSMLLYGAGLRLMELFVD